MKTIVESLLVGFYSLFISIIILHFFNYSMYMNAFIIGFLKHFVGGISGIQQIYCSNYIKCDKFIYKNLILESIGEGLLFSVLYSLFSKAVGVYSTFFLIGMFLHLISDALNIHSYFCKSHCKKK